MVRPAGQGDRAIPVADGSLLHGAVARPAGARLCLQLLYGRRGAIRISLMADHGHNLVPSRNIDVAKLLSRAGFRVAQRLDSPQDVVLEVNGLVTYAGIRTMRPAAVAD